MGGFCDQGGSSFGSHGKKKKTTVYWDFLQGEERLEKTHFAMLVSFRAFATSLMSACQDLER